jgi:hypothetical protein
LGMSGGITTAPTINITATRIKTLRFMVTSLSTR